MKRKFAALPLQNLRICNNCESVINVEVHKENCPMCKEEWKVVGFTSFEDKVPKRRS